MPKRYGDTYTLNETEVDHILYLLQSKNGGAYCTDHGFAWNKHELTVCKRIQLKLENQQKYGGSMYATKVGG